MSMVLKLTDEETERLRKRAEAEHRSMQQVARLAVMKYLDEMEADVAVHDVGVKAAERWKNLLDRLGQ